MGERAHADYVHPERAQHPRQGHLRQSLSEQTRARRHREEDGDDGDHAVDQMGAMPEAMQQKLRHGVDAARAVERQQHGHEHTRLSVLTTSYCPKSTPWRKPTPAKPIMYRAPTLIAISANPM